MKLKLFSSRVFFAASIVAAATAGLASCGGSGSSSADGIVIDNFAIDETIRSGRCNYEVTDTFQQSPFKALLSVSIQWPEKLGGNSVTPLQDTLKSKLFATGMAVLPAEKGSLQRSGVEKLMRRFLSGEGLLDYDGATAKMISDADNGTASDDGEEMNWYCDKTARIRELTEQFVTYRVQEQSYTGGAHPNTSTSIFTYSLIDGKVLTAANMFVAEKRGEVVTAVKKALAEDLDTTPDKLAAQGIDMEALDSLGQPYLADGCVNFFFDYYSIAAYYMGSFDLSIPADDISDALTPAVKAALK